ncbi:calcineurin-like phosphoesterase [Aspergillus bertholletiae]|uniref:Calcineurin-like phosphoesterase n=1 Tax=Aspergillus bertholletiae TaxID=1226010 RepID=A0A5N7BCS6_9EURO|nr:calcineurin-like phosphoesterase [Aspergillus bertholletiae]
MTRPSTSFQVLSDLHLELNLQYHCYDIPICADHLILAGDIGRLADYDEYRKFLQKQTDRFKYVFLVLGNHEFYNGTFATGLEKPQQLEREPCFEGRLIVLHRKRYDVPQEIVQMKVKDFQKIEAWSVDDHNANYDADLAWLLNEINSTHLENGTVGTRREQKSILVVTHHAPLLRATSSPQHVGSPWSVAFATDVLPQIPDGVDVWVFGHTHYSTDFMEGEVRVMSNQRGYALPWNTSKKTQDEFDVKKVIRVS